MAKIEKVVKGNKITAIKESNVVYLCDSSGVPRIMMGPETFEKYQKHLNAQSK